MKAQYNLSNHGYCVFLTEQDIEDLRAGKTVSAPILLTFNSKVKKVNELEISLIENTHELKERKEQSSAKKKESGSFLFLESNNNSTEPYRLTLLKNMVGSRFTVKSFDDSNGSLKLPFEGDYDPFFCFYSGNTVGARMVEEELKLLEQRAE